MLTKDIQIRDPFVFVHENTYYLYGSTDKDIWRGQGTGFEAYKSSDLASWVGPHAAFKPPRGFWGTRNFWAPEVYEHNGAFYMFASFIGDGHMRGTAVLRAEHPGGTFTPWSDGAVTPRDWMCLDGTLFTDDDGKPWIVFCHEWVQTGNGTICAARLSGDLRSTISEPITLFASSDAKWSAKAFSPSNNTEGYVTDGCFLHRTKYGQLLMLWSCRGERGYCLGYAVSESGRVLGPWKQSETPLFAEDGGHGMIFRALDNRLMLALHTPNDTPNERAVFIELTEMENGIQIREGTMLQ